MKHRIDLKEHWRGAPAWAWLLGAVLLAVFVVFFVLDENAASEARKDREMQALANSLATPERPSVEPGLEPAPESAPTKAAPAPAPPAEDELAAAEYERRYDEVGMDAIGGVGSAMSLGQKGCSAIATVEASGAAVPNFMAAFSNLDPIAVEVFCPQYATHLPAAVAGFGDGAQAVGVDVAPGTYQTSPGVTDCYWERTTGAGATIANDFVSMAPEGVVVTVREGEGFVTRGCGGWVPTS